MSLFHPLYAAWRMLVRQSGYALLAVLTIGLGVGASTAMYSVVDGVLLQPLPVGEPDRLVEIAWQTPRGR